MACVNVTAGILNLDEVDFAFPGFIPFSFQRSYRSASAKQGLLGPGWSLSIAEELTLRDDTLVLSNAEGREVPFEVPRVGAPAANAVDGLRVSVEMEPQSRALIFALTDGSRTRLFRDLDGSQRYRLYRVEDRHRNALSYLYTGGRVGEIIDTLGRRFSLRYDGAGNLVEVRLTAPVQHVLVRYAYGRGGQLVRVETYAGSVYEYEYAEGLLVRYTDSRGVTNYAAYDAQRRCVKSWCEGGFHARTYQYDHDTFQTLVTDALGWSTVYRYDEHNLVHEIVDPLGGVSQFHYDAGNNLALAVNQVGSATLTQYDEAGRVVAKTRADGSTETFEYDGRGRLVKKENAAGGVTSLAYSEAGDLLNVTTPTGRIVQFEYDERGGTIGIVVPGGARLRRVYSNQEISYYHGDDLLLRQRYDAFGRRTEVAYRGRYVISYQYDRRGRLVREEGIGGGVWTYAYDGHGRLLKMVDARGVETTYQYNAAGLRVATITDGQPVRFAYDLEGRLTHVQNSQGEVHEVRYDRAGRMTRQMFFDGSSVDYAYDLAGVRTSRSDSSGREVRYESDALGRPTRIAFTDGSTVEMEYGPLGGLTAGERGGTRVEFEYDDEGRIVVQRQDDYELQYSYGEAGLLEAVVDSEGRVRQYGYDEQMRLEHLALNGTEKAVRFDMQYDMLDVLEQLVVDGGVMLRRANNGWKRPQQQQVLYADSVIAQERYSYDAVAQLTSRVHSVDGRREYVYDKYGLLHAVRTPAGDERYAYDAQFNLTAKQTPLTGGDTVVFRYGKGGRLEQGDGKRFEYDGAGRLVAIQGESGTTRYAYSDDDLLQQVTHPDGRTVTYTYDALRRRVRKQSADGEQRFFWDRQAVWREVRSAPDGSDRRVLEYVYDPHSWDVWSVVVDGVPYLAVNGPMGAPIACYDAAGARVWHRQATAWGEQAEATGAGADLNAVRFWGQYRDDETGLHYNINRYYDPSTARYTTPDPIGLLGGTNLYRYAPNPVNYADPYGLKCHNFADGEPSTLYRGDSRPPSEICKNGFQRQDPSAGLSLYQHVEGVPDTGSNWISTAHQFDKAADFGKDYSTGDQYVYTIANPGCGKEVDCDPDVQAKYGDPPDANSETEIAFDKDIPPTAVMGYQKIGPNGPGDFVSC